MAEGLSPYERERELVNQGKCRAVISSVDAGSPAQRAGLEAGMVLVEVEGAPLTDIIEWRWYADSFEVEVTLDTGEYVLIEREMGEAWGISFTDVIFDELILCKNACTFCFMTMLPKNMRKTLYLRDDDYRLSFLQGNFVTLTNLSDEEVERIIEYDLQPLHVSLHAVSSDVRQELIGRNADRGIEVLERLLDAGIQVHTQIVVCPGVNDGLELTKTLGWIEARPNILSCGIVPLGYTKFQKRFSRSFSDDPDMAAEVIELVREYQEDSGREVRNTRFHLSDEFYLNAGYKFPPAQFYDGYPQFHDGIGMMRSFIDDWEQNLGRLAGIAQQCACKPKVTIVVGLAFARVLGPLVEKSPIASCLEILPVENEFFGGNVDVSCLLAGADLVAALKQARPQGVVLLPRENFNHELLTLDDMSVDQIAKETGCTLQLCTYCVDDLLEALA